MMKMKFKCTLVSDIILNRTSSSEGNQQSLDFIPGNNFLGIVAAAMYDSVTPEKAADIFHSGKVRFGDAHPSTGDTRGLKVPLSMFYPKLQKMEDICYIHHNIDDKSKVKDLQLKQCREGFYSFDLSSKTGTKRTIDKGFSQKSAYDSEKGRSEDACMFGYESLPLGLVLYFEVESDLDDQTNEMIKKALLGRRRVGRSRTAEFGLVDIEEAQYNEVCSSEANCGYITVYADGRLIFLNDNGEPTFRPTAKDLDIKNGEIIWEKSQVRTFQYSPWNSKRYTYDTDRCGIEKGSVFVVKAHSCPSESRYVGCYKNEGFGKVIYNPDFLNSKPDSNGETKYKFEKSDSTEGKEKNANINPDTPLLKFLESRKEQKGADAEIFNLVNKFVEDNAKFFEGESFASQWGSIRSIAMTITDSDKLIESINNYLDHGVAKDKWEERGRKKKFDEFINLFMKKNKGKNLQDFIINLSSEMAKKCKNEKTK